MLWIILLALLPLILIIGGVLYFNIYLRKQIKKDVAVKPVIDQAYIDAEKVKSDDEDFGSIFDGTGKR